MKPCRFCKQPGGTHKPHCSVAVVAEYGAHVRREGITDKQAIRIALELAREYEGTLIDSYRNVDDADTSKIAAVGSATRRIEAFDRVLNRFFGGKRSDPTLDGKRISMLALLTSADRWP